MVLYQPHAAVRSPAQSLSVAPGQRERLIPSSASWSQGQHETVIMTNTGSVLVVFPLQCSDFTYIISFNFIFTTSHEVGAVLIFVGQ